MIDLVMHTGRRSALAVLLFIAGAIAISISLLAALADEYRRQIESFSWAEQRCEGTLQPGLADSAERHDCMERELGKGVFERHAVWVVIGALGFGMIGMTVVLAFRDRTARGPHG